MGEVIVIEKKDGIQLWQIIGDDKKVSYAVWKDGEERYSGKNYLEGWALFNSLVKGIAQ